MKKKILIAFGTRPEAIKLAPVIKELRKFPGHFHPKIVLTAQHRQIVDPILKFFNIRPDYDMNIMKHAQDPFDITQKVLQQIKTIYHKETPDWVIVQGDTTSAFAAALGAFYEKIPVAHVEAGLRTTDPRNPFPEEMNRRLISRLTSLHFAATQSNRKNLLQEGVRPGAVFVTGNPVIDALTDIVSSFGPADPLPPELAKIDRGKRIVLLTSHRRENFGEPQRNIFEAVNILIGRYPDIQVVYPVHPNPAVLESVKKYLRPGSQIELVEPLDYINFIRVMSLSYMILTDSGGVQEEAPALGKPVLVLRSTTERGELLASGVGILAGTDREAIIKAAQPLLEQPDYYKKMARKATPFGEGKAAPAIVEILKNYLPES